MGHELEPCFLVAAPSLACPFFNHTVVLLVDHREGGSLGFVVNRASDLNMARVLDEVGIVVTEDAVLGASVMNGGPVSPETGWVVFDPSRGLPPDDGMLVVNDHIGVSANLDTLKSIASGEGPDDYMMMLGYAGWGPGQLDDEIRDGSWIVVDLDPKLIFETPVEDRWVRALAQLGIDPARVAGTIVADA
jgi:putative transcriptional regulator